MNRRSFLSTILAAAVAPAIVRADSLMRIVPRYAGIVWPSRAGMDLVDLGAGDFTIESWYRFAAPIVRCTELLETTSGAGITGTLYEYSIGEVEILTGNQGGRIRRVWADGQEIPLDRFSFDNGRATVRNLPIGDYGNRVPNFEFEVGCMTADIVPASLRRLTKK